jgi:hypothetical protein
LCELSSAEYLTNNSASSFSLDKSTCISLLYIEGVVFSEH